MQRISRAPELSATLSLVSCWIIGALAPVPRAVASASARQRPRLDHPDEVPLVCLVGLVVSAQLAGPANDLLVGRMAPDHGDLDRDRLVGAGRDHVALAHLLGARLRGAAGVPVPGSPRFRAARRPVAAAGSRRRHGADRHARLPAARMCAAGRTGRKRGSARGFASPWGQGRLLRLLAPRSRAPSLRRGCSSAASGAPAAHRRYPRPPRSPPAPRRSRPRLLSGGLLVASALGALGLRPRPRFLVSCCCSSSALTEVPS